MDNTKLTKGGWTVLINAKYSDVFKIKSDLGFPLFGENEANALLIYKAPEMLEMLQRIMKTYDKGTQTYLDCQQLIRKATEL